jgi:hypothetical protein
MAITIPSILLFAAFRDWSGGFAPPGRYILEVLPVLAPAAGLFVWRNEHGGLWLAGLATLQIFLLIASFLNRLGTVEPGSGNPAWTLIAENVDGVQVAIICAALVVSAILAAAITVLIANASKSDDDKVWPDDSVT